MGDSQIHELAYDTQRRGVIKDEMHRERFNESLIKDIHQRFGLVSLSQVPDNMLMWSHYSDSHNGFCLGLDAQFIYKNFGPRISLEEVNYQTEIPKIDLFEDPINYFIKIICTKSTDWAYEKEYRLVSSTLINKPLDIMEWAIKEIYLGAKMT